MYVGVFMNTSQQARSEMWLVDVPGENGPFKFVPLENELRIKKHILLYGGVATAMCLFPDFKDYFSRAVSNNSSMVYDIPPSTALALLNFGLAVGHAVVCTGWNDVEGYWVCKNSWGTAWADQGYFKIKYGASCIMPPDDTYGAKYKILQKDLKPLPVTPDPLSPGCYLFTPPHPMHLMTVAQLLVLRGAFVRGFSPAGVAGLKQLVLDNMEFLLPNVTGDGRPGVPGGLAGLYSGPFRLCDIRETTVAVLEGSGIVRSPPPPRIPQPPAPVQVPVYSTPLIRLGPFGQTAAGMTSGRLDHWDLAVGGGRPITSITVFSGSDPNFGSGATMFQIRYGDMDAPRVGRPSGSTEGSLQLSQGEYISAVWVSVDRPPDFYLEGKFYSGERLQGVRFVSNTGRSVTAGYINATSIYATACPFGAYQLVSVKVWEDPWGLAGLSLVYAPRVDPAPGPAVTMLNDGWICQLGLPYLIRLDPDGNGQGVQCASHDGQVCLRLAVDGCYNALQCAAESWEAVTCSEMDGYKQPRHPCSIGRTALGAQSTPKALMALVTIFNICDAGPVVNRTALENVLFTGNTSLSSYVDQVSYGRFKLDNSTFRILELSYPCPSFIGPDCTGAPFVPWYGAVKELVMSKDSGLVDHYKRAQVYLVPANSNCGRFLCFLQINPTECYMRGRTPALDSSLWKRFIGWQMLLPDALEASGLADTSTPMGGASTAPAYNAPNLLQLGFARALALIRREELAVNRPNVITVPAQVDSPVSAIHIHVNWMLSGQLDNLFLSYRVRRGIDGTLPVSFHQRVLVHRHVSTDPEAFQALPTVLLKSLGPGQAHQETPYNLLIAVLSVDSSSATVSICRYSSSPANCDSGTVPG